MGTCHPSLAAPLPLCPFVSPETGALAHVCRPPAAQAPSPEQRLTAACRSLMWCVAGSHGPGQEISLPSLGFRPSSVNEPVHDMRQAGMAGPAGGAGV